jgi:hypothetical protein
VGRREGPKKINGGLEEGEDWKELGTFGLGLIMCENDGGKEFYLVRLATFFIH